MGFLDIQIWDVLDIILVGILIYQLYQLLRGSLAFTIFIGLLLVYLVSFVVSELNMNMLASILGKFLEAGIILLVIVFQQEIRRFLFYIGKGSGIGKQNFWQRLFKRERKSNQNNVQLKEELIRAINNMAASKTGCLLVFVDPSEKAFFTDTGVPIDGDISSKLVESIFSKTSPLHDGAVVITENRIVSAGCVLPVSENPDLPARVGMRHRAAAGASEQLDADVIIVSEETGKISHAKKGKLRVNITQNQLAEVANAVLGVEIEEVPAINVNASAGSKTKKETTSISDNSSNLDGNNKVS